METYLHLIFPALRGQDGDRKRPHPGDRANKRCRRNMRRRPRPGAPYRKSAFLSLTWAAGVSSPDYRRAYAPGHAGGFAQTDHRYAPGDQFHRGPGRRLSEKEPGSPEGTGGMDQRLGLRRARPEGTAFSQPAMTWTGDGAPSPVYMLRTCAHICCVNSMALKVGLRLTGTHRIRRAGEIERGRRRRAHRRSQGKCPQPCLWSSAAP